MEKMSPLITCENSFCQYVSVQVMCTCLTERQSPDLIIASRNGLRAMSLWAAAWATTTLHCCKESDWTNSLRLCRLVLFLVTLYSTIQPGSRHGYFCRQLQQSLFIAHGPDWGLTSSASCPRARHLSTVCNTYLLASIGTYSIFRSPSMSDIHLPAEHTRLTESRSTHKIELDLSALFSNF